MKLVKDQMSSDQNPLSHFRLGQHAEKSQHESTVIKTLVIFYYTGWCIVILILAYYNPYAAW